MNETDLTAKGFVRDSRGEWIKPSKRALVSTGDLRPSAELERDTRNAALVKAQAQGVYPGKVLVRVTSVRNRLLDEDNLCEKYHVDCLRYSGVLATDGPRKTKIEVCQRKADKGEAEQVIVEIFKL